MGIKKLFTPTIKVKKTSRFYFALALIALFFVAGFVHNNNIAYIVMFFLFSILLVSMIMGRAKIKKAKVNFADLRVFANEEKEPVYFSDDFAVLKPRTVRFDKRGRNEAEFELYTYYPLGVAKFSKKIKKVFLVYPQLKGKSFKEAFGGNEDFETLKEYEGEGLKYVHWASVAKGEIKAKKFSGGENQKTVFDYNEIPGDKETKISQLALWAFEAYNKNVEFQIVLPGEKIDSKEGFDEVFKKLALY